MHYNLPVSTKAQAKNNKTSRAHKEEKEKMEEAKGPKGREEETKAFSAHRSGCEEAM